MAQNEIANSTVHLNGEQAKQELTALAQKAQDLRKRLIEANEAGNGKAFEKLNKELNQTNKQMKQLSKEAFDVKKVLDNLSGATMSDLIKAKKEIDKQLNSPAISRNSKEWKELQNQLKSVKTEMAAVSAESKVTESSFSKLSNLVNKSWQVFAASAAAVLGVVLSLKSAAMEAARMSDVYASVRKYTGESAEGVAEMNAELKKMNTRTSRDELNRLLGEAGKLGVTGKENLLQFAKAADIIQVSLGEDLGADAVKNIGKLTYMFGVQDKMGMEKSMLAVGSAINQVGQSSTASESYLLEFTNRLSGMGVAAGLTIPQIIGFGSVLDQNAQQVEMSSTAMNKFISTLAQKSEKVATAIGIPAAKLKKAVGEDMNAALLMVFEQLNKKGGLVDLAPLFSDLGTDGARAASVITILASKYRDLTTEQALANKSFNEGTSVIKEFEIQNNTLQGKLDKAKKAFLDASETLGNSLSPALLHSTNATTYLIKGLAQLPAWLKENKGLLWTLAVTMGAYTIALNLNTIAVKLNAAQQFLSTAWTKAGTITDITAAAAKALLTGNISRARAAMRLLNAELMINPWVALGALITATTVLIYKWATAQTDAQKAQKDFNAEAQKETIELNNIFEAYKRANEGTAEKSALLTIIKEKYGQYIKDLIDEKGNITDIEKAQLLANRALREQIALKVQNAAIDEVTTKEVNKQAKTLGGIRDEIAKQKGDAIANYITGEIGRIFASSGDMNKAFSESNSLMQKYGVDTFNNKGMFKGSLTDDLRTLGTSFYKLSVKSQAIKNQFAGIISNVTTAVGTGTTSTSTSTGDDKGGGNAPNSPTSSKPEDPHKKQLEEIDTWITEEQIKLKKRHLNNEISEEEYADKMVDLTEQGLIKKQNLYEKTDKEYLNYDNQIQDIKLKRQDDSEKLSLDALKELQNARLNAIVIYDNLQRDEIEFNLQQGLITQDEHDNKLLALDKVLAEARLFAAQENAAEIATFNFKSDKERIAAVEAANKEIEAATKNLSEAEKKILLKKLSDKKEIDKEIREIEKKYGIDTYKDKQKEYQQDLKDLKTLFDKQLKLYENDAKKKAEITKKYESDVAKIKLSRAQSIAGNIADVMNKASELSQKLQESEALAVDNKYAKQLKAARKAGKDTTKLEEKIEEEKKAIKKKYADIDFAITVGQIIANTALAIMKAAPNVPLQVLEGALGLAQLGLAVQQRKATQNLWTGGFTEPGGKYEPRGIVHAGEFVGAQEAVNNTPIRRVFNLVDYAQKTNTVARITNEDIARVVGFRKGFSEGGFTGGGAGTAAAGSTGIGKDDLAWAIQTAMQENNAVNAALLAQLQAGITAKVAISGNDGVKKGLDEYAKLLKNTQR